MNRNNKWWIMGLAGDHGTFFLCRRFFWLPENFAHHWFALHFSSFSTFRLSLHCRVFAPDLFFVRRQTNGLQWVGDRAIKEFQKQFLLSFRAAKVTIDCGILCIQSTRGQKRAGACQCQKEGGGTFVSWATDVAKPLLPFPRTVADKWLESNKTMTQELGSNSCWSLGPLNCRHFPSQSVICTAVALGYIRTKTQLPCLALSWNWDVEFPNKRFWSLWGSCKQCTPQYINKGMLCHQGPEKT